MKMFISKIGRFFSVLTVILALLALVLFCWNAIQGYRLGGWAYVVCAAAAFIRCVRAPKGRKLCWFIVGFITLVFLAPTITWPSIVSPIVPFILVAAAYYILTRSYRIIKK